MDNIFSLSSNASLAGCYVDCYVANESHADEEREILRRGVTSQKLAGCMAELTKSFIDRATEEELNAACAYAEKMIFEALEYATAQRFLCDGEMLTAEEIDSKLAASNNDHEYCRFNGGIFLSEGLGDNCERCPYKQDCKVWPAVRAREGQL